MKKLFFLFVMTISALFLFSAEKINAVNSIPSEYIHKKQEFRGVWVTTAYNLDVPKYTSETQYKTAFTNILNNLEAMNMNAMVFQVRPMGGAFYPSDLNPWDRYVSGTEGVGPVGWDPLLWMVEEAHKRGIEFHAWFNPYRIKLSGASSENFAVKHPEYVVGDDLLNPGEPAVQQFIVDTVMEVARNYDIDAIHFDDYFYPYGGLDSSADSEQFNKYNPDGLELADWRRENVNNVIRSIKEELTEHNQTNNKAVQLGMGPFGIWANYTSHPDGSNTSGGQSYFGQYADTRKWVKEGWIDYIAPQDYWRFSTGAAPYDEVVDWWAKQVEGTKVNLYIGQAYYNYMNDSSEIQNQMNLNSSYENVDGSLFFRYTFMLQESYGRTAINNSYIHKVLPKPVENVDSVAPASPQNLSITSNTDGYKLTWDIDSDAKAYYVYRYTSNEKAYLHDPAKIIGVINAYNKSAVEFTDTNADENIEYNYFVTAFDRANNESIASGINTKGDSVNQDDATILEVTNRIELATSQVSIVNEKKSKVLSAKTELLAKYTEVNSLRNELEVSLEAINSKLESASTNKTNISDLIESLKTKVTNINNDISQLYTDLTDSNVNTLETKYNETNTKVQSLNSDYQELITQLSELETSNNDLISAKDLFGSNLRDFKSKLNQLNLKYSNFKYNKSFLDEELSNLEAMINKLNDDKEQISGYQDTIDAIDNLNNIYNNLVTASNNINSYYDKITDDKTELESAKSAFYSYNSTLGSRIKDIFEIETITTEKTSLDTSVNDINTKITDINNQLQELKDKDNDSNNSGGNNPDDSNKENKTQDITLPIITASAAFIFVLGFIVIIRKSKK